MSTPEINQVLAQMRVARAQAMGVPAVEQPTQDNFGDLLKRSIDAVNETQQQANSLRTAFEQGEEGLDLAQVMIAVQKSSLSFQAMVEVRNKLVDAYKDVMNMPV
ncbi:MAG: flagellar hook-basal body complex protein FliE [Chromatiaceae bacterium]|nr:flagellar hook-basal body complex protein FliE [Gammaproteobacteria bacterium]MCP5304569.1 flagellar hook-basal body complex protein FliE [Chromatiaceae bacterium]MCP5314296.1 flagellar hook-basal body complex protein FliE [Chromatiaceae bacterium]